MTTILKLGGSVITHKDEPETVDEASLTKAVDTLVKYNGAGILSDGLVLVHGGGSFGHHHAERHSVSPSNGTHDGAITVQIHEAMGRLNRQVVGALNDALLDAVPVRPLSVAHRDSTGTIHFPCEVPETLLAEGFIPVIHGDVISHVGKGVTILSGDEIVVTLAEQLEAECVGLCSTVPGVLDQGGNVISEIASYEEVASVLGGSKSTDVTGGMAGKVQALLGLDTASSIFDLDGLAQFLQTGTAGTRIRSE